MARIRVVCVGRPKEPWIEEGIEEYTRRLKGRYSVEQIWVRDDDALTKLLLKERGVILLTPEGKTLDSPEFAQLVGRYGAQMTFVVGGADGLPKELRQSAHEQVSFSRLTFTHQMARLILAEQLYRAVQILAGSPYHREG